MATQKRLSRVVRQHPKTSAGRLAVNPGTKHKTGGKRTYTMRGK